MQNPVGIARQLPDPCGQLTNRPGAGILNGYHPFCICGYGGMADAPDLGSGVFGVQVQVLLPAPSCEGICLGQVPFCLPALSQAQDLNLPCNRASGRSLRRKAQASSPVTRTTSEQALYRLLRFFQDQSALMPLLLLFREKSRSVRLLVCKRSRDGSQSLPTFHDIAPSAHSQNPLPLLCLQVSPVRTFAPSYEGICFGQVPFCLQQTGRRYPMDTGVLP